LSQTAGLRSITVKPDGDIGLHLLVDTSFVRLSRNDSAEVERIDLNALV
jgi:hypothetical protein